MTKNIDINGMLQTFAEELKQVDEVIIKPSLYRCLKGITFSELQKLCKAYNICVWRRRPTMMPGYNLCFCKEGFYEPMFIQSKRESI